MKQNQALKVLYLYNSIFVFASNLIGPLFAVYIQQFDHSALTISLTWAIFIISTTIFSYLFSKFGDKVIEQEYGLLAGFLIRAAVWFAFIFTTNIYVIFALQIVLGLGEALGSPSFDALRSIHIDQGRQISECSDWIVISNLSMAAATIIGGLVVSHLGFPILFLTMFILALLAFFGVFVQPRNLL